MKLNYQLLLANNLVTFNFLVLKIGFSSDPSVVSSDGKASFKIGILSGKVQFGVSVHVMLNAIGPTEGIKLVNNMFLFPVYHRSLCMRVLISSW